jgi:hypothetical protein
MKLPGARRKLADPVSEESSTSDEESENEKPKKTIEKKNDKEKIKVSDLPYRKVPALKPVVEVPPVPVRRIPENPVGAKKETNYKNVAPIEEKVDVDEVVERILGGDITISHAELFALSKKYRDAMMGKLARKRVPVGPLQKVVYLGEEPDSEKEREVTSEERVTVNLNSLAEAKKVKRHVLEETGDTAQNWVVEDPILQYLDTLSPEERKKQVFVGRESETLRVIPALINGVKEEEALLDTGSQIVSMSKETAVACQIQWDPDVTINMQSANGHIEKTCGLARDVPFRFGAVAVYLQVHVLASPAYKVLLGRPFDVLTESEVRNTLSGGQVLVITDPNTKQRTVLPTYARGELPSLLKREKLVNFQEASRI